MLITAVIVVVAASRDIHQGSIHRHDGRAHKVEIVEHDHKGHENKSYYYQTYPKHYYEYKVEDKHTGDIKSQHESRDGDVVKGYYSLHDADDTVRIVHYTADKHNGFNTQVDSKGYAVHIVPTYQH